MTDLLAQPPAARALAGREPIAGTEAVVRHFWAWALSGLRENVARHRLEEFLLAWRVGAQAAGRVE